MVLLFGLLFGVALVQSWVDESTMSRLGHYFRLSADEAESLHETFAALSIVNIAARLAAPVVAFLIASLGGLRRAVMAGGALLMAGALCRFLDTAWGVVISAGIVRMGGGVIGFAISLRLVQHHLTRYFPAIIGFSFVLVALGITAGGITHIAAGILEERAFSGIFAWLIPLGGALAVALLTGVIPQKVEARSTEGAALPRREVLIALAAVVALGVAVLTLVRSRRVR